jgi:hypothetical protein
VGDVGRVEGSQKVRRESERREEEGGFEDYIKGTGQRLVGGEREERASEGRGNGEVVQRIGPEDDREEEEAGLAAGEGEEYGRWGCC